MPGPEAPNGVLNLLSSEGLILNDSLVPVLISFLSHLPYRFSKPFFHSFPNRFSIGKNNYKKRMIGPTIKKNIRPFFSGH